MFTFSFTDRSVCITMQMKYVSFAIVAGTSADPKSSEGKIYSSDEHKANEEFFAEMRQLIEARLRRGGHPGYDSEFITTSEYRRSPADAYAQSEPLQGNLPALKPKHTTTRSGDYTVPGQSYRRNVGHHHIVDAKFYKSNHTLHSHSFKQLNHIAGAIRFPLCIFECCP